MITLTPKENARELFNIYWDLLLIHNVSHRKLYTKQCALIAVDLMKYEINRFASNDYRLERLDYLEEVKNEIENYKNE